MSRKTWRRALALTAIVAGALLMWLSPEAVLGAVLMLAGIAIEAIGIRLEHS
jgi:drug/metabolite transporter (DMT)-like permease